jgi:hypothetical protein
VISGTAAWLTGSEAACRQNLFATFRLLGFWQMMNAAVGARMGDAGSHDVMFGLGILLTIFSSAALGPYRPEPGLV